MARGGKRQGAGRKATWRHKGTKLIRVPKALSKQILQYAHELDMMPSEAGERQTEKTKSHQMSLLANALDYVTESNDIGSMGLADLAKRLNRHKTTVIGARKQGPEYFAAWSQDKDPDGVEWEYRDQEKLFYPVRF